MGFFERHPVFKRTIANQYQAILAAGAVGFSILLANPLPLLVLLGAEFMAFPFLFERLRRRMEIEKKFAERRAHEMTRDERLRALSKSAVARLERTAALCDRIQENYRGLSPASQDVLADQRAKFDALQGSFLKRLWIAERYDEMAGATDPEVVQREIAELERTRDTEPLPPRVVEALEKNLEIKQELLAALEKNDANRIALNAELDSLEALLQLLLQKSVAATDAVAFSAEIDDVLAQAEADAATVEEMERMLGALPELAAPRTPTVPRLENAAAGAAAEAGRRIAGAATRPRQRR